MGDGRRDALLVVLHGPRCGPTSTAERTSQAQNLGRHGVDNRRPRGLFDACLGSQASSVGHATAYKQRLTVEAGDLFGTDFARRKSPTSISLQCLTRNWPFRVIVRGTLRISTSFETARRPRYRDCPLGSCGVSNLIPPSPAQSPTLWAPSVVHGPALARCIASATAFTRTSSEESKRRGDAWSTTTAPAFPSGCLVPPMSICTLA